MSMDVELATALPEGRTLRHRFLHYGWVPIFVGAMAMAATFPADTRPGAGYRAAACGPAPGGRGRPRDVRLAELLGHDDRGPVLPAQSAGSSIATIAAGFLRAIWCCWEHPLGG